MKWKTHIAAAIVGTALITAYSGYTLLETFVLPSNVVSMKSVSAESTSGTSSSTSSSSSSSTSKKSTTSSTTTSSGSSSSSDAVVTDKSYEDDNIKITIKEKTVDDTQVYIADIYVKDSSYLNSGLADNSFGENLKEKTSEITSNVGAILAINGDFYGFRDTGYVMRNGYLYRSTSAGSDQDDLVVYEDGTMEIVNEGDVTASELKEKGATDIYSFGPGLVSNGKILVSENTEVSQSMSSNPRTAIGMVESGHYVMIVSDGRTSESQGLSLYELAGVMKDSGCTVAYNLDGGGSSTMVFNCTVVNKPTTNGNTISERSVSDIIYIGK